MENEKLSVEKKSFFDHPRNVKRLLHFLYASCALLLLLDFVIHRHAIHRWENLWGFYPIYGFVGCVILVQVAAWMRSFLMRAEDYYDSEGRNNEEKVATDESLNESFSKTNKTNVRDHNVDG